jgi:2-oxoglutarate dehydrogenase E2 component (dihydrolipoamide succinyltransferase)
MTDVVMPQMGVSIVEGTLTKWLKKPGQRVERDEPLFEISTDKVDTEIPSPAAGVVSEVLVEEGKTVAINTVVARIEEGATAAAEPAASAGASVTQAPAPAAVEAPAPTPVAAAPPPSPSPVPSPEAPAEPGGPMSPLVRKMAREHNIDLSEVKGTGAGGRITKQDVEAYLAQSAAAPAPPAAPPAPPYRNPCRLYRLPVRLKPVSNRSAPCAPKLPSTWFSPSAPPRTSPPFIAWI